MIDMGTGDSSKDVQHENAFRFNSRDEVIAFDNLVKSYLQDRTQLALSYYSLIEAYDELDSRIFYSYFDIVLSIIHLESDLWNVAQIFNENFSKKSEKKSIFDSRDAFYGKMDMHRYQVSFVLRYRAIWDKIMGFIILMFSPEDYDDFARADSRKKSFKTIVQGHLKDWSYLSKIIKIIDGPITSFDDEFRTPEAHFTGRLRKWSFLMIHWREDPTFKLYGYLNLLNHAMHEIRKLIEEPD